LFEKQFIAGVSQLYVWDDPAAMQRLDAFADQNFGQNTQKFEELPEKNAQRMKGVPQNYKNVLLDGTERPIQCSQAIESEHEK
jgi:hypothetical protein